MITFTFTRETVGNFTQLYSAVMKYYNKTNEKLFVQ